MIGPRYLYSTKGNPMEDPETDTNRTRIGRALPVVDKILGVADRTPDPHQGAEALRNMCPDIESTDRLLGDIIALEEGLEFIKMMVASVALQRRVESQVLTDAIRTMPAQDVA
jgi:hypothetical protein